jgi:hypothetical protein
MLGMRSFSTLAEDSRRNGQDPWRQMGTDTARGAEKWCFCLNRHGTDYRNLTTPACWRLLPTARPRPTRSGLQERAAGNGLSLFSAQSRDFRPYPWPALSLAGVKWWRWLFLSSHLSPAISDLGKVLRSAPPLEETKIPRRTPGIARLGSSIRFCPAEAEVTWL